VATAVARDGKHEGGQHDSPHGRKTGPDLDEFLSQRALRGVYPWLLRFPMISIPGVAMTRDEGFLQPDGLADATTSMRVRI